MCQDIARLNDVNTTDILDAIRLGCATMCRIFNADDDNIPFFEAVALPEPQLNFSVNLTEAHVPGRHLNALLTAEDVAGIEVQANAIEHHANAAFFSFSGPVSLPLNRDEIGGKLANFMSHNVREGLHALYALTKYRDSQRAYDLTKACIESIFQLWDPKRGWNVEKLHDDYDISVIPDLSFVNGLGRAIGPLIKFYHTTSYAPALELASILKEKAVSEYFTADGAYEFNRFGHHCHSVTSTLSSLAIMAGLLDDRDLLERVRLFYDNGLNDLRDQLGWSIESMRPGVNPDRGEVNTTGDMIETALILGRFCDAKYYQDAERMLRCHCLPSQLRDISFIPIPDSPPDQDGRRDVAKRIRGAFGFPAPYGHQPLGLDRIRFNLDIVGGVVASLCEAYRDVSRSDSSGHWVNLLFDHETDCLKIESPYTHDTLNLVVNKVKPLYIRLPCWLEKEAISITGASIAPLAIDGYMHILDYDAGQKISLAFPFPLHNLCLQHGERQIRVKMSGDEVIAMDNFNTPLTFFPRYH